MAISKLYIVIVLVLIFQGYLGILRFKGVLSDSSSLPIWCKANPATESLHLQDLLDLACGREGASCHAIQEGGSCYEPNTLVDHASYAFHAFSLQLYGTCDFSGAAEYTTIDPSRTGCPFSPLPPRTPGSELIPPSSRMWCVPKPDANESALQMGIDYVCGSKIVDCAPIHLEQPCNLPNSTLNHATWAFNAYWGNSGGNPLDCDFSATAAVTDVDPSWGECKLTYEIVHSPIAISPTPSGKLQWCIADPKANVDQLQAKIDWLCNNGVYCKYINEGDVCFEPNNIYYHASWVFNAYWETIAWYRATECDFDGLAMLTTEYPGSVDTRCKFNATDVGVKNYCIANLAEGVEMGQNLVDNICLQGADCSALKSPNGLCTQPNDASHHASWALNSLADKKGDCSSRFGMVTTYNPSHGDCVFPIPTILNP